MTLFRTVCVGLTAALGLYAATPSVARAQLVGYQPGNSPYRDFDEKGNLALVGGYLFSPSIPGNVGPRSAPMIGIRYDYHVFGPAYLEGRWFHAFSERDVVNPDLPLNTRTIQHNLGVGVNLIDLGFAINLTGMRTTHSLVPVVNLNVGVASDLGAPHDVGGYRFGTNLALSGGLGLRYIPAHSRFKFRFDVGDYLYSTKFPNSYRDTNGGTPVVSPSQSLTPWRQHLALTGGASIALFR
ncbi:MAG TPA: hypothetical protein VNW46_01455 [Gemmatimonadaceae bacterium]|nr:hypothetical protein [Gemmatimonadaceae bacterium]